MLLVNVSGFLMSSRSYVLQPLFYWNIVDNKMAMYYSLFFLGCMNKKLLWYYSLTSLNIKVLQPFVSLVLLFLAFSWTFCFLDVDSDWLVFALIVVLFVRHHALTHVLPTFQLLSVSLTSFQSSGKYVQPSYMGPKPTPHMIMSEDAPHVGIQVIFNMEAENMFC